MEWNAEKIKTLRCRMGWSQSDLARRLNCDPELVIHLEQSNGPVPEIDQLQRQELVSTMMMLENQAESHADQVLQESLAEVILEETHEQQIDQESVRKRFWDQ